MSRPKLLADFHHAEMNLKKDIGKTFLASEDSP